MKRLAVLRHAKSSWSEPELEDFDRPLSGRGWEAARRVGRELAERGLCFDLIVASPAVRVRQTIDGLGDEFKAEAPIRFDPRLYLADEDRLLALVRELPEKVRRPLLVGHNPGLERLLVQLAGNEHDQLRSRIQQKFPTAAFALAEVPADRWDRVEWSRGTIVELIVPKELD